MKLNARILLITIIVIGLVTVTSSFIYYSFTDQILVSQHQNDLLKANSSFKFAFQFMIDELENEYYSSRDKLINGKDEFILDNSVIDFIFRVDDSNVIDKKKIYSKQGIKLNTESFLLTEFVKNNPDILLNYSRVDNGDYYYYGQIISESLLKDLSKIIHADIAYLSLRDGMKFSNNAGIEEYILYLKKNFNEIKNNDANIVNIIELDEKDIFINHFQAANIKEGSKTLNFLLYAVSSSLVDSREKMKFIMSIMLVSGIGLSIILVLLLTLKTRNQISVLSEATKKIMEGHLNHRVRLVSNDEVGKLSEVFNNMLDKLEQKEIIELHYKEIMAVLNSNSDLETIAGESLRLIVKYTGMNLGALYSVCDSHELRLLSSYGMDKGLLAGKNQQSYYINALESKERIELFFEKENPKVCTSFSEIEIRYELIIPIVFNSSVVAILELASFEKPADNPYNYVKVIEEQLAIGLMNSLNLEKLKKLVGELKELNDNYQIQNRQISEQNEKLQGLHNELKIKAQELEEQKEKAVALTRLKSEFLANMSHELRTPLNSILGLSELVLKDDSIKQKSKKNLNIVLRNGKKLLNLINNILEFSKADFGKTKISEDHFLLSELVEDLISFAEPLANDKNLMLNIIYSDHDDLKLKTDKSKLEQILFNLIGNGIKFTDRGRVEVLFHSNPDNSLTARITDTGIGISEENRKIIFEEFRQADGSTARPFGGTGLGLAISKKYADVLKGKISVNSEEGKGTTFILDIPDVITDIVIESENIFGITYTNKVNDLVKKVALINYNADAYKIIKEYLNSHSIEVVKYGDTSAALEQLFTQNADAAILDPDCAELNGWEFLIKLKQNNATAELPVIMAKIHEENNYGYGFDVFDYSAKPLSKIDLSKLIRRVNAFNENPVENIYIISEDITEYEKLKDEFQDYKFNYISNTKAAEIILNEDIPDLIISDLFFSDTNAIELFGKLKKQSKVAKVIINFEEEVLINNSTVLNGSLEKLTLEMKNHTLDLLGLIKRRLKIQDNTILKDKLIMEDFNAPYPNKFDESKETHFRKGKILIVDDDKDTLYTVGEIIKDLGYEPVFASNGVECLLALNNGVPDLILLDIMMPKMDGFETIKLIRRDPRFIKLPIFALTAQAMLENKDIIEKNGFTDIVTKPINSDILVGKLNDFMNNPLTVA